jgi:hypothetical protein
MAIGDIAPKANFGLGASAAAPASGGGGVTLPPGATKPGVNKMPGNTAKTIGPPAHAVANGLQAFRSQGVPATGMPVQANQVLPVPAQRPVMQQPVLPPQAMQPQPQPRPMPVMPILPQPVPTMPIMPQRPILPQQAQAVLPVMQQQPVRRPIR